MLLLMKEGLHSIVMVCTIALAGLLLSCSTPAKTPTNTTTSQDSTPANGIDTKSEEVVEQGPINQAPDTGFRAIFLDVGQGDATLLIGGDGTKVLIDSGLSPNLIIQRLVALDVDKLDAVIASHADADHIGGMAAVIKHFEVKKTYWNGLKKQTNVFKEFWDAAKEGETTVLKRGQIFTLGPLVFEVAHPTASTGTGDHNGSSVVLLAGCAGAWLLLTGDAEYEAEKTMIESGSLSDIDVLKLAHHGSDTGTSEGFLDATTPEHAIVSAGLKNKYGHPDLSVIKRLDERGIVVHYTDEDWGDESVTMVSDCRGTYSIGKLK